MTASRDPSSGASRHLLPQGEKGAASDLLLAQRECRVRAGVLVMDSALPEGIAVELQRAVLAAVREWLREEAPRAPEHVRAGYVAFNRALGHRKLLEDRARARREAGTRPAAEGEPA
jgi:hypothetical protein